MAGPPAVSWPHLGCIADWPGRVAGPGNRVTALCRAHKLLVLQPWLCCIATQPATLPHCPLSRYSFCIVTRFPQRLAHALLSRYNDCIVTHSPTKQPPVTMQFILSQHSFSLSQTYCLSRYNLNCIVTCSPANCTLTRLCHDTIFHCIVTQFGQYPKSVLHLFLFFSRFSHIFFLHFCYWKTPKKNIYPFFFHFPIHQINL